MTEESKYSEVLKSMGSDVKLVDLGADVRSIRRTQIGEMILELKCYEERKASIIVRLPKSLVEGVLGKGVEVTALTATATPKVKNLDEIKSVKVCVEVVGGDNLTCTIVVEK